MFVLTKREDSILPRIIAPLLAALMAAAAFQGRAEAAPAHQIYVISDTEGYGVVECLTQKRDCGKIVADSWCEAHGHGAAVAFGRADDITASIPKAVVDSNQGSGAAIISCAE
jgi:hypothetical protein